MHRCLAERRLCELTGQDGRQQHQHSATQIAGLVWVDRAQQQAWTKHHLQLLDLKWKSAVRVHYVTDYHQLGQTLTADSEGVSRFLTIVVHNLCTFMRQVT